jgi:hypothetical protein
MTFAHNTSDISRTQVAESGAQSLDKVMDEHVLVVAPHADRLRQNRSQSTSSEVLRRFTGIGGSAANWVARASNNWSEPAHS